MNHYAVRLLVEVLLAVANLCGDGLDWSDAYETIRSQRDERTGGIVRRMRI